MRILIDFILTWFLFVVMIAFLWERYEIAFYGTVKPDRFDTVITLILSWSLTFNVYLYHKTKP